LLAVESTPISAAVPVSFRLMVQVPPGANGRNVQVLRVTLNRPPPLRARVSAVIDSEPAPVLVTVTTLVSEAPVKAANVRVRTPKKVPSAPLVALVKLNVPGVAAVPVSVTGEPVTVVPV